MLAPDRDYNDMIGSPQNLDNVRRWENGDNFDSRLAFRPQQNPPIRFVMPGTILLAVIAWALASVGFSFYLSNFANFGVILGSLGTAVALLDHRRVSSASLRRRTGDPLYRRALWGAVCDLAYRAGTGSQGEAIVDLAECVQAQQTHP
jgi:hypothetical protein